MFVNSDSLLCAMAPAKLYAAVDFGGPFLDWLLEHFRQQQKAGEGLDLHLQAENPEDKVSLHQVLTFTNNYTFVSLL